MRKRNRLDKERGIEGELQKEYVSRDLKINSFGIFLQ